MLQVCAILFKSIQHLISNPLNAVSHAPVVPRVVSQLISLNVHLGSLVKSRVGLHQRKLAKTRLLM